MKVVDSNTVIECLKNNRPLPADLLVPDDLYSEYLVAETVHGEKIKGIVLASTIKGYDEVHYLREYAKALNSFTQLSFAKSRGFGDVSIIALVSCLISDFGRMQPQLSLDLGANTPGKVIVVTDDEGLRRKLSQQFGSDIDLRRYGDLTH